MAIKFLPGLENVCQTNKKPILPTIRKIRVLRIVEISIKVPQSRINKGFQRISADSKILE